MVTIRSAGTCLLLVLMASTPAAAQRGGDGFLFAPPTVSFGLRGGYDHAFATSDLFEFTARNLTVGRGEFGSFTIAGDIAIQVSRDFDLVLGLAYASSTTVLRRVPLTAGLRYYVKPRGRTVGRFAWIPARTALYAGAGAGIIWYRFHQYGDFIDFNTQQVFADDFESSRGTGSLHLLAGTELGLTRNVALSGEARFTWAKAPLEDDFTGFHRLDLTGLSLTTGLSLRF
jgi:hypothetical protein